MLTRNSRKANLIKLVVACIMLVLLFAGCATTLSQSQASTPEFLRNIYYVPTPPIWTPTYADYNTVSKTFEEIPWPSNKPSEINPLLPNYCSSVVVQKFDSELSIMGSGVTGKAGHYRVTVDFIKYRQDTIRKSYFQMEIPGKSAKEDSNMNIGDISEMTKSISAIAAIVGLPENYPVRVGCGVRMIANLQTYKTGLNLGSIIGIAVAAKAGYLKGELTVDVIGMDSKDISHLVPLTAIIDETSMQSALQALATIKSRLHDEEETKLYPHIVSLGVLPAN